MSSPDAPTPRATVLEDFVVATSDRRRELRGERWEGLRQGLGPQRPSAAAGDRSRPAPRFEKGLQYDAVEARAHVLPEPPHVDTGDADGCTAGRCTPAEKLALLMRHALWPLRWEPLNGVGQHRAVGTPGALFPVDTYLLAPTSAGPRALYCSPRDLCLLEVGPPASDDAPQADAAPTLVVVANLGRCVGVYGDLALSLTALEAGMLQAQLAWVTDALGWRLESEAILDPAPWRTRLGIAHWSELPLLQCRLHGDEPAQATTALPARRLRTLQPRPHHAAADTHPLLRDIVQRATMPDVAPGTGPSAPAHTSTGTQPGRAASSAAGSARASAERPAFHVLSLSERRSSGAHNGVVRWTGDLTADSLEDWLADARHLLHRPVALPRPADPAHHPLQATLVWRPTRDGPPMLLRLDRLLDAEREPAQLQRERIDADPALLALARSLCQDGTVAVATIGIDAAALRSDAGLPSYLAAHRAAGGWAQALSLAAAHHGLTARLFQAYPDEMKNRLLPLRARTLVQILIGRDPRPNPAYRLF